ncbi:tRNA pseudouridine(38-40) synthase TruA [Pirellulales bacterium]|nr:tRNA pseudouridine(38-40) synthase TruA [Pirellulales bacterium]
MFKLIVAYDGTDFSGWQRQQSQRTVQGAVEEAWREITGEDVSVSASGRTDAGVHALGQVVGVASDCPLDFGQIRSGLNAKLPDDVVVLRVESAPEGFHATSDAKSKHYRYLIHNDRRPPLFDRRYAWHVPGALDVEAMHRAGQALVGRRDFASFQSTGSPRDSTVRTIFEIAAGRGALPSQDEGWRESRVAINVVGDGFLYHMVRTIAGTLVRVGQGSRPESWIDEVLASCDRREAGQTAPAQGLSLVSVEY